ncbi:MAG: hypothetical protein U5L76_05315 [Patescibacteria group bacterium]|nr:hypothetical protein [Patescibacteria group bacterium]
MKKFLVMIFAIVMAFPLVVMASVGEAERLGTYSDSEMEKVEYRITETAVKWSEVIKSTIIEEVANTAYKKTWPAVAEKCMINVKMNTRVTRETRKETSAKIFVNVSNIMVEDVSSVIKKPNFQLDTISIHTIANDFGEAMHFA